jgi:hypothetical protein
MFFLIKLLLLPVWLPLKLLWEIVEHSGHRSHRRRRRTAARSGYHATSSVTLADGSIAHFRCEHAHRTQTAALECAAACQRKIERGEGNHLITSVQESEAVRQRRLALEAERERQRQAERQARAAEKAARKAARAARRAGQPAGPWPDGSAPYPLTAPAPGEHGGLGWPVWGLIGAMGALVLGLIVAMFGGGSQHSPATTAGALLWVVALIAIAACVPAALWQWVTRRRAAARPPGT